MRPKLNTILLVDDHEPTNVYHTLVIKSTDCVENIVVKETGLEALEYLTTKINGVYPKPELIFLDINMPKMNGWEFLEAYHALEKDQQGEIVIVMLTTSVNPDDKVKAIEGYSVADFKIKPLSTDMLNEILDTYFTNKANEVKQ